MWDSNHFTTKRSLLKYKIVLFNKYIIVSCGNASKSNQFLLGVVQEGNYIVKYVY